MALDWNGLRQGQQLRLYRYSRCAVLSGAARAWRWYALLLSRRERWRIDDLRSQRILALGIYLPVAFGAASARAAAPKGPRSPFHTSMSPSGLASSPSRRPSLRSGQAFSARIPHPPHGKMDAHQRLEDLICGERLAQRMKRLVH